MRNEYTAQKWESSTEKQQYRKSNTKNHKNINKKKKKETHKQIDS